MKRAAILLVAVGCSVSSDQKSFDAPPNSLEFTYVSEMLGRRCGSLDCHGQPGRPLRLFGKNGLRFAEDGVPGQGPSPVLDESDANYASVLALEPEIMHAVFHDGGRDPARLTLVRKAENAEHHKGGRAFDANGYRCFTSWLAGEIDKKACVASKLEPPPGYCVRCQEDDPGTSTGGTGGSIGGSGGTGGTAGTETGGSGGTVLGGSGGTGAAGATGGTGATGGSSTGGTSATGGSGGTSTGGGGGVVCGPGDFWPCTYDGACVPAKPSPADHDAHADKLCQSCHAPPSKGGTASDMLLGGVVWILGAGKGAEHVEVGLREGNSFLYVCTDSRGFFFVPAGAPEPNWLTVENRIRAELGEKIMPADKDHKATCNDPKCHGDPKHQLWAP